MSRQTTSNTKGEFHDYVVRLRPFHYLHLKDTNTNVVRVVIGPSTLTCLEHEQVVFGPEKMVVIPPRHFAIIENPVVKTKVKNQKTGEEEEQVVFDQNGQVLLRHGDKEVRFEQAPFPLFDGEKIDKSGIQPLQIVEENVALRLKALRDFFEETSSEKIRRKVGQEWYFIGPGTYKPLIEVQVVETVRAIILKPDQALKVKARDDCVDYQAHKRKAGEEWLVFKEGAYLPQVSEKALETIQAYILTDKKALHLRAKSTFTGSNEIERKAGSEWIVTNKITESYIPGVYEEVTREVDLIVLTKNTYCIIKDPVDKDGKPQLGTKTLVKGPKSFFLQPGESIDGSIRQALVLAPDDAIWVTAVEEFTETVDNVLKKRRPGDVWLICGPGLYWTPIEAQIQKRIKAFLKFEPLSLYFFQPGIFFGVLVIVLLLLYFLFFRGSSSAAPEL